MTREELVEVVARAIHEGRNGKGASWRIRPKAYRLPYTQDAQAALTALCAALGISDAALDALAKGEAVVVPREATKDMDRAALEREYQGDDDDLYHSIYRAMVSASPYAARDAEGGA
jgi:hypothetical protein